MQFALTDAQVSIRAAITKICATFDDAYWLEKDRSGSFPSEAHKALAGTGWLTANVAQPLPRSYPLTKVHVKI
jgi:acyl-CoA dehydrogenase